MTHNSSSDSEPRTNRRQSDQDQDRTATPAGPISRRRLLAATGAAALPLVAGCNTQPQSPTPTRTPTSDEEETPTQTPSEAPPTQAAEHSATPSPTPTQSGTPSPTPTPYPRIPYPTKGAGRIGVSVFTDFAIPSARDFWLHEEPKLRPHMEDERIVLQFFHLPKPVNKWSRELPSATVEVMAQKGPEAFWPFMRGLFRAFGNYSYDVVQAVAEDVGANPEPVVRAAQNRRGQKELQDHADIANMLDVDEPFKVVLTGPNGDRTIEKAEDVTAKNIKHLVDQMSGES